MEKQAIIQTYYFGMMGKATKDPQYVPISIARKTPKDLGIKVYPLLSPSTKMLNSNNELFYCMGYTEHLKELSQEIERVVNDLLVMADGKTPLLLCYEKYHKSTVARMNAARTPRQLAAVMKSHRKAFCHRHIVSRWLTAHGFYCEEFQPQHSKQMELL